MVVVVVEGVVEYCFVVVVFEKDIIVESLSEGGHIFIVALTLRHYFNVINTFTRINRSR